MSFVDAMSDLLDELGGSLKANLADHIDLETADDKRTLVTRNGSLVSVLSINGFRTIVSGDDILRDVIAPMETALQSALDRTGHRLALWFESDPERNAETLELAQSGARVAAARLGLSATKLLQGQAATLDRFIATERILLVLYTLPSALNRTERKQEGQQASKNRKWSAGIRRGQDPLRAHAFLRNRHRSWVKTLVDELMRIGMVIRNERDEAGPLAAATVVRLARAALSPMDTPESWRPSLPGDVTLPQVRKRLPGRTEWDILWPPLPTQIQACDAVDVDGRFVRMGTRLYATMAIDLFQRQPMLFSQLFARVREKGLPWRMTMTFEGGGMSSMTFRRTMASMMAFQTSNRLIRQAFEAMEALLAHSETVVPCRAVFATWAPASDRALAERRAADLAAAISGWGGCQVDQQTGDPVATLVGTTPACMSMLPANTTAMPLDRALLMLPWSRPASPFRDGSLLLVSPSGRLMPVEMFSRSQVAWATLVFAPPGAGKSMLMQMMHLALVLRAGTTRLPRISILDVGISSRGFVRMLEMMLPPDQRHKVLHRRLRKTEDNAINIFDTQLGARFPTPPERDDLHSMLTLLVTPAGRDEPPAHMSDLISEVIMEVYRHCSDEGNGVKAYQSGTVPDVDAALRNMEFKPDLKTTTWWDIVDILFNAGEYHLAAAAQRRAVPTLADAAAVVTLERVAGAYQGLMSDGQPVANAFSRLLSAVAVEFPNLTRPTRLDIGEARVIALDLAEVVQGQSGPQGRRAGQVMYMLARRLVARDFYIDPDYARDMPAPMDIKVGPHTRREAYQAYHTTRAQDIREDFKRLCYDEFHLVGAPALIEQVERDIRLGRKSNVDIMLASQEMNDFSKTICELATTILVMGSPDPVIADAAAARFGIDRPAERDAIATQLRLPAPPAPGVFLGRFKTVHGVYTHLLAAPVSPVELWAFTTHPDDSSLRDRLVDKMGFERAMERLLYVFPTGSAVAEIERRRRDMRDTSTFGAAADGDGVIPTLAAEMMA